MSALSEVSSLVDLTEPSHSAGLSFRECFTGLAGSNFLVHHGQIHFLLKMHDITPLPFLSCRNTIAIACSCS